MTRSPFVHDTNYRTQSMANMAEDFREISDEAIRMRDTGHTVRNTPDEGENVTLITVYRQVFQLAGRIAEIRAQTVRELDTGLPSNYVITTMTDSGVQAGELSNTLGRVWGSEEGYRRYVEGNPEHRWYGTLRDFCNSMTDLALIGNELERRFVQNGEVLQPRPREESMLMKIVRWFAKHIVAAIVVGVVVIILGTLSVSKLGLGEVPVVEIESYVSTQTVHENKPTTQLEYLDLDGRGQLVPLPVETIEAAMQFGEAKGEENKIYMHRVVVMALDPSIRYTEGDTLGNTFKPAYDPNKLYTFYIPDGTDITDEDASLNIISAGNKIYRVKLLSIDGRRDEQSRMSYTFRVEELVE